LDVEGADLGPAERPAVPAQGVRDGAYVRPRADAEIEPNGLSRIRDDVERVDTRAAERHLHRDPPAGQLVGALTADLDRRSGRDRQLDLAPEGREPSLELVLRRRLQLLDDLPFRIAGRGSLRQGDVRQVALVQSDEARHELSC